VKSWRGDFGSLTDFGVLCNRRRCSGRPDLIALNARGTSSTYSAVRAKLRVLEEKGHVRHEEESLHYVYLPTVTRDTFPL
jgi:hypothetical protein